MPPKSTTGQGSLAIADVLIHPTEANIRTAETRR